MVDTEYEEAEAPCEGGYVNDTQRLDALNDYGLCLTTQDSLVEGVWHRQWICAYGDSAVISSTLRKAIDAAVLDISTKGLRQQ